jgi:NAD+ kinase
MNPSTAPSLFRRIAVVENPVRPLEQDLRDFVVETCRARGVVVDWLESLDSKAPGSADRLAAADLSDIAWDLILACGGDGTVIQTANRARKSGVPVLGLNKGTLGFLATLSTANARHWFPLVLDGAIQREERMAVNVRIYRGEEILAEGWALNDINIKASEANMITLRASIHQTEISTYRSDGLIVATPTGSTAYNLSAGGPLVSPQSKVLTFTPICPHTMVNRSIVVDSDQVISFALENAWEEAHVWADGIKLFTIQHGMRVDVYRSPRSGSLAFVPGTNYFSIMRDVLCWNRNVIPPPSHG